MDVVRNADWIVDLGPEGGSKGGGVVFGGTPRRILDAPGSLTGQYLARPVLAARQPDLHMVVPLLTSAV